MIKKRVEVNRAAKKPSGRKPGSEKNLKTTSDSTVLIIFLVLLLFIIFSFGGPRTGGNSVKDEQEKLLNLLVINDLREGSPAIVVGNAVDSERVSELASKDYSEIKGLAGITSEFVIYFEDEKGNVINIADKPCIGSPHAQVNGVNCNH